MPAAENHHVGAGGEAVPQSYFVRTGTSSFRSTLHSQGAWQPGEQHMSAASALVIHELERAVPSDKQISRITFDILGVIHSGEFDIEIETVRPGRTIELIEARMVHRAEHTGAGVPRTSVTARVWRLSASDTSPVAGLEVPPFPARETFVSRDLSQVWPGGFIASLDGAEAPGGHPGRRQVWITTDIAVVDGEEDSPYAAFVKFCDAMNGMAVREDPGEVFFPNVDLTIHFFRPPVAGGVGQDISVGFGGTGTGVTHAVFHDRTGPVGYCAQSLTVRLPQGSVRADQA